MRAVEGQRSYYEAALAALRFVEFRRPTKRRFGAEADATWTAFRGDLGGSARIDLLLRDADTQWPGAFGARTVYDLPAIAEDEAFGAAWVPLDDVDAEELWRRTVASAAPSSVATTLAQIARAWGLAIEAVDVGPVAAAEQLLVVGPSAIAATIDVFSRGTALDWHEQVVVLATPAAHRQLAAAGAALLNAGKATRLVSVAATSADVRPGARLVRSPDAQPSDLARAEALVRG